MLANKVAAKETKSTQPKPENKSPTPEEAAPQIQLNAQWNSLATYVGGQSAAGASGDPSPVQRKLSSSHNMPHIQRMCDECEDELNAESEMQVQAKLTVGAPDDPYEKEADAVAAKVMRMPAGSDQDQIQEDAPSIQNKSYSISPIQRLYAESTEELDEGSLPTVQNKPNGKPVQPTVSSSVSRTINSPGNGSPLNESIRSQVEPVLGADLSSVRVHSGAAAQDASHSLNAKAFTHQNNIFLGKGQSASDTQLMAHELTHTVQQGGVVRNSKKQESETREGNAKSDVPNVQAAWYNFDIPFTDYQFDPSIEGVRNAANIARDTVVDSAEWVGNKVEEGVGWIFDQIESLVSAGIDWLNEKFRAAKEFAKSSFDDVKNGLNMLLGFITGPVSLITSAVQNMDASLLSMAWSGLATGASAVWNGIKGVIDRVFSIGTGIWDSVSEYVGSLFSRIDSFVNHWAFRRLPDVIQRNARNLINGVRSLWQRVDRFISDTLTRLREFTDGILQSIESFIQTVVSHSIQKAIETIRLVKDAWDYVNRVADDPEGTIRPIVDEIAARLDSEAPPKAIEIGGENLEDYAGGTSSSASSNITIQRDPLDDQERSTASLGEIYDGFVEAITEAWGNLDIGEMLWDSFVNMFWPPATIRAIGHEFYELWTKDWANAASGFFAPRNILEDPAGFFHDIWSNILVILDFPLALWRRLNSVLMLLLGYVTIILVIVFAVLGGIAAAEVGVLPGVWAGALAGLEMAGAIGLPLLGSYFAAEIITVEKAFLDLLTARQTQAEKDRDYVQIAGSLIGMGVAAVLLAVLFLFSQLVSAIVRLVKTGSIRPAAPEGRAAPVEERAPTVEERAPPVEERAPPVEERAPPVEERAPIDEPAPDSPRLSGRRPATPEQPVVNESGGLTTYGEWYYERPGSYRTNTKANIFEEARGTDGVVRDPVSREPLSADNFRIEERPGHDFASRQRSAAERGIGREEFLDDYNNPDNYRPREPRTPTSEFSGPRPATPERPTLDVEGNLTDYGRWYYERPSGFREGVREAVWEEARANSVDGVVRDPLTLEEMSPTEPWDMGHRPGYEFRKHRVSAAERGISRSQFLDEHNNPSHYRPEKPASNRGHQGEAPEGVYLGD